MTSQTQAQLGWIGLGSMGLAMAKNLQKHLKATGSSPLVFTNRTMSRGETLEEVGGVPLSSIAEVVQKSDIIFSSISNDAVLEAIVVAILASGSLAGKVIVDTSTVHPESSIAASEKLSKADAIFVAAPVFGTSQVAEAGQILFVVAGPAIGREVIAPFMKGVMGRGLIDLGDDVAKSSLMKTSGNFIIAAMMEIVSEVHVLAEKTGLGSDAMETLIEANFGPVMHMMSKRLTTGVYEPPRDGKPWSDLNLAIKDVGHAITCAEQVGARLQVGEITLNHLKEAKKYSESQGSRPLDSSSIYGAIRQSAGLDFETDLVKKRDAGEH